MTARAELLREIADCRDEALHLQSRVIDLTERAQQTAGMTAPDRGQRGKVTGLVFGLLAHLEELNRLVREET